LVIVSGEYNQSAPPALMNLLDHLLQEYCWRPSAIVCNYDLGRVTVNVTALLVLPSTLTTSGPVVAP